MRNSTPPLRRSARAASTRLTKRPVYVDQPLSGTDDEKNPNATGSDASEFNEFDEDGDDIDPADRAGSHLRDMSESPPPSSRSGKVGGLSKSTSRAKSKAKSGSTPTSRAAASETAFEHHPSLHAVERILPLRTSLLEWYDSVKSVRGMPWRKDYDPSLDADARAQRAYEVLVSEIMLQQTQWYAALAS